jgi:hypothetical protein
VSKRSKRRRGPQAAGEVRRDETGRAAEAGLEAGDASARQASGAESRGRTGEARRAGRAASRGRPAQGPAGRRAPDWGLGLQIAFLAAVFAIAVIAAELAGAANLGVALGVGQIAFAIVVIYLLARS